MEYGSFENLHAKNEATNNELAESVQPEMDLKGDLKQHPGPPENIVQVNLVDSRGDQNVLQGIAPVNVGGSAEANMEASMTADDVLRAGGFGARDDISHFLPVASDSTDFEASLRDARNYEDPQKEICRPGLGWTEVKK